jgi:hypothetical protein
MTRFTITLSAPATDTHEASVRRMRSFLKSALRAYGLKCVACRQNDLNSEAIAVMERTGASVANDRGSTAGHPRKSRPYDERLIAQHAVAFGW